MIAHLLLAIGLAAPRDNRVALATIELEGPLTGIALELGTGGETRIVGSLLEGERRTLDVPVDVRGPTDGLEPTIRWSREQDVAGEHGGRARFLRWVEASDAEYARLPPAMRARPRPPLERRTDVASPALALLLASVFLAGLSLRRRSRPALLVALLGVGAVLLVGPRADRASTARLVLTDGDAASPRWVEVEAALDRLTLVDLEPSLRVEVEPEGARVTWHVPLAPGERPRVVAPGARLYRVRVVEPGDPRPTRAENGLDRPFAETWLRTAGEWTAHGRWETFRPWPPAERARSQDASSPPGWLASGLPQGPDVLLGRLAGEPAAWVRITGF